MTTALRDCRAGFLHLVHGSRSLTRSTLAVPARAASQAVALPRAAVRAVRSAGGEGVDRQVWAAAGHAMLEVRGLDAHDVAGQAVATTVERAVAAERGITWARIDPVTRRIAVRYDRDRHTVADLVRVLAGAEERVLARSNGHRDVPTRLRTGEPAAPRPVREDRVSRPRGPSPDELVLAADLVALVAAAGARLGGLLRPPASLAAVVALAEHQPWLRARIEGALGPDRTTQVLGLANAVVNGLVRNVPALLLDTSARTLALRAEQARQRAFTRRSADLRRADRPSAAPPAGTDPRPVPLPPGAVQRLADRTARGSLVAAVGLFTATVAPDLAGRAVLVGVPRAAYAARDGFANGLCIGLADRGVVVRDPDALRRLDRVTAVVVQSGVLHEDRPLVVDARADAGGWTTARIWRAAQRLLDGERKGTASGSGVRVVLRPSPDADPPGGGGVLAARRVLAEDGRAVGEVLVGRELSSHADAVLSAVRDAGLRLVLTEDVTAPELSGRADEILRDGHGDPAWLRRAVRDLQAGGAVVAVVGSDQEALDAADVGIGVCAATGAVPWAADLICGPGLLEVPRLIGAVPVARDSAAVGVRAALGATFLGALLLVTGRPGSGGRGQLPVTLAAGGALLSGLRAGRGISRRPDPTPVLHTPWYALEPEEVLSRLPDPGPVDAEEDDLDHAAPAPVGTRALALAGALVSNVRAELADPLTPVLATGAAASAVIGSPTDALLVGGVLLGSAVISGTQRMRAERALRELLRDQRLPARVVSGAGDRGSGGSGALRGVPATGLRPGHLIDLEAGDVVPADARLLTVRELEVDEATLTGESTPVGKDTFSTPGADLPDRTGMVYEGTTVVAGSGRAVVVATGAATEAGRALALAGRAAAPAGLQARLEELTRRGLPATLLGGAAVAVLALVRGSPLRTAVSGGVSAAVAAVPEGLPLMATVAQLGAARRLSRRGVLVRSSRTVEALGRVDTICFDKTGTLSEGRLRLVQTAGLDGPWDPDVPEARRLLRDAAHAGPAPDGRGRTAHATDAAVFDAARGLLGPELDEGWEELVEIPFHSDRGFSAVLGRTPERVRLVVKGAPEVLLPRCSHVRDEEGKRRLDRSDHEQASAAVRLLAAQGLRVLAVARRSVPDTADGGLDADDVAGLGGLTLLGFLGLADAPRPQAAATVAALHAAGIATVMITGDHPVTAAAIARRLGFAVDEPVTGPELAGLEEPARIARIGQASVFARVSPEQKLQIIEGLRRTGHVVGMAGDGANDAAAIRMADVGIGMAAHGSTSARNAADLVLTAPDISLVLDALVEGRAMWRRVRDAVALLLGGNVGEVAFTLMGTALAGRAPISTRQFLLVNMFTDLLPSMALVLAPTPADPQARRALLATGQVSMGRALLRDIGARGAVTALAALAAWLIGRLGLSRRRASTIALGALVGAELGQTLLLAHRDPLVLGTALGSGAVLAAVIQTPGVSQFFGCTPLDPVAWAVVLTCSAAATVASAALPRLVTARRRPPPARGRGDGGVVTVRAGGQARE